MFSFMATNEKQTDVELIRRFNDWEYLWYKSLNKRMLVWPRYAHGTGKKAMVIKSVQFDLLPTRGSNIFFFAGISNRLSAEWMSVRMVRPSLLHCR